MKQKIDPGFSEWLVKERLSRSIAARFLVRFHVSLILGGSIGVGWLANKVLYQEGVKDMLVRHPIAVVASYLGFLAGLQLWIRYSGIQEYLNARRSDELLESKVGRPVKRDTSAWDWIDVPFNIDGDGCLLVLLFLLVAVVAFAMGGYLIVYASDVMAELVFELLLAAGLIKGIRRVDLLVSSGIPTITVWALIASLTVSICFGLYARTSHPGATTIGDVVREIRSHSRP